MDKYATIARYLITMFVAPFAAKYIQDATQLQNLTDALVAFVLSALTLAPLIYNLFTRPSSAAMQVAVEADKVIAGEKKDAVVQTPGTQPDITIRGK